MSGHHRREGSRASMREQSIRILRSHSNLNLGDYKPFLIDFQNYSSNMFTYHQYNAKETPKAAEAVCMGRTQSSEVKHIENLSLRKERPVSQC